MATVDERVRAIAAFFTGESAAAAATPETNLRDLIDDSLDIVEFVMDVEDEFGREIPDEDAEKLATLGDLVTYLA